LYARVSGSNINQDTSYVDLGFSWLPKFLQANAGIVGYLKRVMTASFQIPSNTSFLIILQAFENGV
jgi:hypothetical protein